MINGQELLVHVSYNNILLLFMIFIVNKAPFRMETLAMWAENIIENGLIFLFRIIRKHGKTIQLSIISVNSPSSNYHFFFIF